MSTSSVSKVTSPSKVTGHVNMASKFVCVLLLLFTHVMAADVSGLFCFQTKCEEEEEAAEFR